MDFNDTPARNTRLRKRVGPSSSTPTKKTGRVRDTTPRPHLAPAALETNIGSPFHDADEVVTHTICEQPAMSLTVRDLVRQPCSTISTPEVPTPDNPTTTHFEFAGTPGTSALLIGMPATVLVLNRLCDCHDCFAWGNPGSSFINWTWDLSAVFNWTGLFAFLLWIGLCYALYFILPGKFVNGTPLRNGLLLQYKLNALSTYIVTHMLLGILVYFFGLSPLLFIADHFMSLAGASILFSYGMSLYVYIASFYGPDASGHPVKLLALGGNSGQFIYDFFIGRELNPRLGSLDLKYFFELRPGLIGWNILNLSFLAKQFHTHQIITNSMVIVVLFQGLFIVDALLNEQKVLSTMDITTDGFGFMLIAGDVMWVPFLYTLQAHYLCVQPTPENIGHFALGCVFVLNFVGYYIFRKSNSEKDLFRSNPNHPKFVDARVLTTQKGTCLLADGWWGKARHVNYLGDWLMAAAWSLICGFSHPVPYFYPVYFAILLVHRFFRDEHKCRNKYGHDWDRYCELVPYRIIPYVW